MKKFFALTAVLGLFVNVAAAQEFSLKNFRLYGEGSLIGYAAENGYLNTRINDDVSNSGGVNGFATLGVAFDVYENITAAVAFGYANNWGEFGTYGRTVSNTNDDGYLNVIRVVEAHLTFEEFFRVKGLSARVGRQYYGDEDSTVMYLGLRHYQPELSDSQITSIDAVTAYYDNNNWKANAVYGNLYDNGPSGNWTLMGGDVRYMNIFDMLDIQAYIYNVQNRIVNPSINAIQKHTTFVGLKPVFRYEGLKASVEFAKDFGGDEVFSNEANNTNLIKADVSYTVPFINLTPRATYFVAGGENKAFYTFGNYVPGIIYGQQLMGIGTYIDQQVINIGVDYPLKDFIFSTDYYNLTERDGDFDRGNEVDFMVKYRYVENVEFHLAVGHLFAGDQDFDSSKVQGGVSYKFQ